MLASFVWSKRPSVRAPMSRLADRYAMVFLAATIALAGASWLWSADSIRAVTVLVVATPSDALPAHPRCAGGDRLRPVAAWKRRGGADDGCALAAAKDRKMISRCDNRTASLRTTSRVD